MEYHFLFIEQNIQLPCYSPVLLASPWATHTTLSDRPSTVFPQPTSLAHFFSFNTFWIHKHPTFPVLSCHIASIHHTFATSHSFITLSWPFANPFHNPFTTLSLLRTAPRRPHLSPRSILLRLTETIVLPPKRFLVWFYFRHFHFSWPQTYALPSLCCSGFCLSFVLFL